MTAEPPRPGPPDDPQPYTRDYETERPDGDGEPPRPASTPRGSQDSAKNDKTLTDPMTGEPNPDQERAADDPPAR